MSTAGRWVVVVNHLSTDTSEAHVDWEVTSVIELPKHVIVSSVVSFKSNT